MEEKTVYTTKDLMERYNVSYSIAKKIGREIRALCGTAICRGKYLPQEIKRWEESR